MRPAASQRWKSFARISMNESKRVTKKPEKERESQTTMTAILVIPSFDMMVRIQYFLLCSSQIFMGRRR